MEQKTQSMFCPQASLISPFQDPRRSTALMQDTNGDGQHDVILEKDDSGNTYLHLVMPATAVNFLNGADSSNLFDFADSSNNFKTDGSGFSNELEDVYVELGCKVYEVNKVLYRGGPRSRAPSDLNVTL
jgi:hypothetical protein